MDYINIKAIVEEHFELNHNSIHGPKHWKKVEEYGLKIAQKTEANTKIVRLFALLHDSKLCHDGIDKEHGFRGAEFVKSIERKYFNLNDKDFATLIYAIQWHNKGLISDDPTIGTCWDADRLDLPRAGIYPRLSKLNTEYGKLLAIELRETR